MTLIIGCGFVGTRVADLLQAAGDEVVGITLSPASAAKLAREHAWQALACDVGDAAAVRKLAESLNEAPARILHCASSNRGGAEMYRHVHVRGCTLLLEHFPKARLLFTSSSSVYPQTDGAVVTEDSDASPDRETSRLLRETEDLVLSHGGCVARLAGIYGPGRSFVLKNFLEGSSTIEGNGGDGRLLNQIHRDDAAGALMHLLAGGLTGIFNVVDDRPMTQRECFTELARRFHKPLPPTTAPEMNRKRAWTHKRLSNAKLRATGWAPRFPSYFDALDGDVQLVPSILAQLDAMGEA